MSKFVEIATDLSKKKKVKAFETPSDCGAFANSLKKDPSPFPSAFFAGAVIGPPGSGKSVLVNNLIEDVYPKAFAYISLVCPEDSVSSWKSSIIPAIDKIYHELTIETIEEIVEAEKAARAKYDDEQMGDDSSDFACLVVFDDCASEMKSSMKLEKALGTFIRNRRHRHSCQLWVAQDFVCIPKSCRKSLSFVCAFASCSVPELEALNRGYIGTSQGEFLALRKAAFKTKYDFLGIRGDMPSDQRYFRNFKWLREKGDSSSDDEEAEEVKKGKSTRKAK